MSMSNETVLDCDAGRSLGCATYCCRLIVRLAPGERDPSFPDNPLKNCVDKDPKSGLCLQLDPETSRCNAWSTRPKACRVFDCNDDARLQVVLQQGFVSLTQLATSAARLIRNNNSVVIPALVAPGTRSDSCAPNSSA